MSKCRELKGFRRGPARRGMNAKHYGKFRPINAQAARFLSHPKRMRKPRRLSKRQEQFMREQSEATERIIKRRAKQSLVRRR